MRVRSHRWFQYIAGGLVTCSAVYATPCPSNADVAAQLEAMGEDGAPALDGRVRIIAEPSRVWLQLLSAQGAVLASSSLPPDSCAALAQAAAVVVSGWTAELANAPPMRAPAQAEVPRAVDSAPAPLALSLHRQRGNHQRRKSRFRRYFAGSSDDDLEAHGGDVEPSPDDSVERMQKGELLYWLLDRMRERDRRVLVLFELEQRSGEEIAELLQARVETVWVWLHRARARFRALYLKHGRGDP